MKPSEFCDTYKACREGRDFALQFETMAEVWNACERPDWLFWILEKHAPLEKEQSVSLAIAVAETALIHVPEGEERPALAIQAARNWLENPSEENRAAAAYAAVFAARAAADAAFAARAAAYAAVFAARAAAAVAADAAAFAADAAAFATRNWLENPSEENHAAARSAARAARKNICSMIREAILNPFQP